MRSGIGESMLNDRQEPNQSLSAWRRVEPGIRLAVILALLAISGIATGLAVDRHGGPAKSLTVCIDPGHGGRDTGALENGVAEKDVNLDIALRTRDIIESGGYRVVMTRDKDEYVSLARRCAMADGARASILLSVHNNSRPPDAEGTTTYFYRGSEEGGRLASFVQGQVVLSIRRANRGTRGSRLYVVSNVGMPAALLEGVFLSNVEDARLIKEPRFRQKIAEGAAAGVLDYLADR
jgi:N-acetylmuramoyl-L-alanine amidase